MKNDYIPVSRVIYLIVPLLLFGIHLEVFAQHGHYWTENYGNKSSILSGAVIASVEDLGAVFYNPGRLAQIENPAFIISGQVFGWSQIKSIDGIKHEVQLTKSGFSGVPSLIGGTFTLPFLKGHKFSYSYLTRQRTDADLILRIEEEGNILPGLPGNETVNGSLEFNTLLRDNWYGLTWSSEIGKGISIGLSNFLSVIKKSSEFGLNYNASLSNGKVASLRKDRQYDYEVDGLIWKMGVAWENLPFQIGLTITTPRINFRNKGSVLIEEYQIGLDNAGGGNNEDTYLYYFQRGMKSSYHSPFAIGLGFGYHFNHGIIHMSAELYNRISRYTVLETDPYFVQSSGDSIQFKLYDEIGPVLNYGIGIEWHLSKKMGFYGSFASDHSGLTDDIPLFTALKAEAYNSVFRNNIYQIGSGISLNTNWADISLGIIYKGPSILIQNFSTFNEDNLFFRDQQGSTIKFSQWRLILGFSFPFAEKFIKKLDNMTGT